MTRAGVTTLGVDVGTGSTKGVLVDAGGEVLASATRKHTVDRPHPGHVEMDAGIWWDEFVSIAGELLAGQEPPSAVGVSGMGPCVLLADADGRALRPAILYGVDTRATEQIARIGDELGREEILDRCGSLPSTQAVGPKIAWVAEHEPDVAAAARRLYMPSSWLVAQLTGEYVLDHHSASQSVPLYDSRALEWYRPWAERVAPGIELPPLRWPGEVAGTVTAEAADATGLAAGTPVITGTVDAWAEAVSVGATRPGDLMLMYGTTMFLVATTTERLLVPELWSTVGAFPDTRNLAGGMATSGAIAEWLRALFDGDHAELTTAAEESGPGANGLLMLPYFAGERTPIADPDARGVIAGLTVSHTRGDLYRAALEATAFGVRHNVAAMRDAGADPRRLVAVGGGTTGRLWPSIVSDVTGLAQDVPEVTIGASYGGAYLAALTLDPDTAIDAWNPVQERVEPDADVRDTYDERYAAYLDLYPATRDIVHRLAATQD